MLIAFPLATNPAHEWASAAEARPRANGLVFAFDGGWALGDLSGDRSSSGVAGGSTLAASGTDSIGEVLDLVYDAALETGLWTRVIERIADTVGGAGGALIEQNQRDGSGHGVFARADPETVRLYFDYPYEMQLLLRVDDPAAYMRAWRPLVLTDEDWLPKDDLVRSAFYNEFLRRVEAHSVVFVRLLAQGFSTLNLNLGRQRRAGPFGAGELALIRTLHPHLIRSVKLARRVGDAQQLGDELTQFLDASPHGLFLLDGEGRVRRVNRTGERLAREHDGLSLAAGRLRAATSELTGRLEALTATAASRQAGPRRGGSIALASPSGRAPLSAIVAPVGAERLGLFQSGPSVIVCVTDLGAGVAPPAERLRDLFGLTRTEARVALALLEGDSPREAARQLGVSFYTVRGHLAQIFDKTGVKRQSEMVRLMLRAVGPQDG